MAEINSNTKHMEPVSDSSPDTDPLASLHKMSTTAGLGSGEYVAINGTSVAAVLLGVASASAWLGNILLIVPVVAIVFAIVAIRQVRDSNGTQTGKGLAILGLLIALGISGTVVGKQVVQVISMRQDASAVTTMIQTLGKHISAEEYDTAYGLFDEAFQSRISKDVFIMRWKSSGQTKLLGHISSMDGNGLVDVQTDPNDKVKEAIAMGLIIFQNLGKDRPERQTMVFRLIDGQWKIHDIPQIFPPPAQPRGQGAGPGTGI